MRGVIAESLEISQQPRPLGLAFFRFSIWAMAAALVLGGEPWRFPQNGRRWLESRFQKNVALRSASARTDSSSAPRTQASRSR
jgi:hypothetical protein